MDFFNALNHANKSNPVSDISAANLDPTTGPIIDPQNFGLRFQPSHSSAFVEIQFLIKQAIARDKCNVLGRGVYKCEGAGGAVCTTRSDFSLSLAV